MPEAVCVCVCVCVCVRVCARARACAQLCPTLWDPVDYSLAGSSVYGIFQARILERVAISYSSGIPNTGIKPPPLVSPALQADSLTLGHLGS